MRTFVFVVSVAVLASACTGRPDDPVFLFGGVKTAQGAPIAGAPLALERATGQRCEFLVFRERARPTDLAGTAYVPFKATATADDGLFLFRLLKFEVEPSMYDWPCFRINVGGSPTGARTVLALSGLYSGDLEVKDAYRLDTHAVTVTLDGKDPVLTAPEGPLPPRDVDYTVQASIVTYEWDLTSAEKPFWRAEWKNGPLKVDARLREDFAAAHAGVDMLSYIVQEQQTGPFMTSAPYEQYAVGPKTALPAVTTPVVAVSRGATCTGGEKSWSPCPLTDGALDLEIMALGERSTPVEGQPPPSTPTPLTFVLTAPARPTELIVRDLQAFWMEGEVRVMGSSNGVDFEPLGALLLGPKDPINDPGSDPNTAFLAYDWFNSGMEWMRVPLTQTETPLTHLRIEGLYAFAARELSFFE